MTVVWLGKTWYFGTHYIIVIVIVIVVIIIIIIITRAEGTVS